MILAGNILNIIAPIIQMLAVTLKNKLKVLFGVIIASVVWVIAYILLGATPAAILSGIGVVTPIINYFFEKKDKKKPWWIYLILISVIIIISVVFYVNIVELIPSFAVLFLVVSTIPRRQIPFRLTLILMSVTWLIYGIIKMQFGIIAGNAIQIVFLIATMIFYSAKTRKNIN